MMAKSLLEYITKIPVSLSLYIYIRIYIYIYIYVLTANNHEQIQQY